MLSLALVAAGLLELAPSALASSHANTNIQKRQALQPRHHESSHSHIKNRRHSKMAKKVKAKKDISVLYSGGGLGTLYYDLNGGGEQSYMSVIWVLVDACSPCQVLVGRSM